MNQEYVLFESFKLQLHESNLIYEPKFLLFTLVKQKNFSMSKRKV